MENWFRQNFVVYLDAQGVEFAKIYYFSSGTMNMPLTLLDSLFSFVASPPPTFTELEASSLAKEGWTFIFDQWLAKGIIQQ